jgi:hypothetical protein
MGSSNKELFSSHKCFSATNNELIEAFCNTNKNIADFRHLGYGKTKEADELSAYLAEKGKRILRILPNYKICKERVEGLPGSMVFRGRSQKGMCFVLEECPEIYDFIVGRNLCKNCTYKIGKECEYLKQFENFQNIVFSVRENLPLLLKVFKPDLVVIDDVNILDIVYHIEDFHIGTLKSAKLTYAKELEPLFDYLLTDRIEDALEFVWKNRDLVEREIRRVEEFIVENYNVFKKKEKTLRSLKILAILYEAIDKKPLIFPYSLGRSKHYLRINWEDWRLKGKRIIYQTATPSFKEKETLRKLGSYLTLHREADPNPNWRVIQLTGGKYSKSVAKKSPRFDSAMKRIFEMVKPLLEFVNHKIVVFAPRELINERFCPITGEDGFIQYIGHYERLSTSTNSVKNNLISCVGGILFKPPLFYLRKPYVDSMDRIAKIDGGIPDISSYIVDEKIRDNEVSNSVKQELARVFRGDKNVKKIATVVSEISIDEDGIIPEIGAIVEKYHINDSEAMKRIKEYLRETYADLVIEKCGEIIKERIRKEGRVKLDEIAGEFERETGRIYSKSWFKRRLGSKVFLEHNRLSLRKEREGRAMRVYLQLKS